MKTTGVLSSLLLLAPLVTAQSDAAALLTKLPKCSLTCLSTAVTSACASLTDYSCICGTGSSQIQTNITPCLLESCQKDEISTVMSVSTEICAAALGGSAPAASSGASSAATSAATSAASPVASSAATGSTSAAVPSGSVTNAAGVPVAVTTKTPAGSTPAAAAGNSSSGLSSANSYTAGASNVGLASQQIAAVAIGAVLLALAL